jgi:hypothetical protein
VSFIDDILALIFGRKKTAPAPKPAPKPAPAPTTTKPPAAPAPAPHTPPPVPPPPPPPTAGPPQSPPSAPVSPPPAAPSTTSNSAGEAFVKRLIAKNPAHLSAAEIADAAKRMGCEDASVRAVLKVESSGSGFSPNGLPIILFEPHKFSRATGGQYDAAHPKISYHDWNPNAYPSKQQDRYAQLIEAYNLNPEAAVGAASWGLFQILGSNFKVCGFTSASQFVLDMAQSEARQLAAFEQFVRNNGLLPALQNEDWRTFAKGYNGAGQVDKYAAWLQSAYTAAKKAAPQA